MSVLPLCLRLMTEGDRAFIVDSWARSADQPVRLMTADEWRTNMRASVALQIARAARVVVLASSDHEATIMGWAVGDDGVVHAAYVRPRLRGVDAARHWVSALIDAAKGEAR